MSRPVHSPFSRSGLAITLTLSAVLLSIGLRPAGARATSIAVSNDGGVVRIEDTGARRSPAHRPRRDPTARIPEQVATLPLPPIRAYRPQSIIGSDDRTQVDNTTLFPNSAIAQLVMSFPNGDFVCTAWMIAPDRLATAGHCIFDSGEGGGFATSITVFPGRNGGTAPFGSFAATSWYVPRRWKLSEKPKFDYGVVKIGSNIGDTVGWFGYAAEPDVFLARRKIKIRGYPADKDPGTMWTMSAKIKSVDDIKLFYGIDTFGGQSGSPAFGSATGCDPCVFGIHSYGNALPDVPFNSATRITGAVVDFLMQAGAD